mmetsp:Transcript_34473/g.43525  ORF Transcript_34473/g.43525 Transcript_34473/m.43525 type:complete len:327 (+) Transcript_34473:1061-2041(+)
MDTHDGSTVAVKIVRRVKRYCESAKIEADILYDISVHPQGLKLCSQILSRFEDGGHYCIVLEELGQSLYSFIKGNSYHGFPLEYVRQISQQLLECMCFLKDIKLIHTDLKPENILVCPGENITIDVNGKDLTVPKIPKIKGKNSILLSNAPYSSHNMKCKESMRCFFAVIDFGGATYDDEHKSSIINTRQYRGPEVILGLGWTFPSDLWSCGCIIAELYSGELFFGTHSNNEHLGLMEKAIGTFPKHMLESKEASKYFTSRGAFRVDELSKQNLKKISSMQTVRELVQADIASGVAELIEGLLTLDPNDRLTAEDALQLPFFSGYS